MVILDHVEQEHYIPRNLTEPIPEKVTAVC